MKTYIHTYIYNSLIRKHTHTHTLLKIGFFEWTRPSAKGFLVYKHRRMVSEMCLLVTVFNPCVWGPHTLTHFLYSENDLVKSIHHQVCLSTHPLKSAPVKVCKKQ